MFNGGQVLLGDIRLGGSAIDSAFGLKTKFVAHKLNYNFHLWSNPTAITEVKVLLRSKQHHDKHWN